VAETKSETFHRLAAKRVEDIADKLRIWSNLSGPSNEFTGDEVLSYAAQIEAALAKAVDRFRETKCWRLNPPTGAEPPPAPVPEPAPEPAPEISEPAPRGEAHRRFTITEIIKEAGNDNSILAEMIYLQRQVIESMKAERA
jgi:hypothetical protein